MHHVQHFRKPPPDHSAPTNQISTQFNNPSGSFGDLNMSNLGAVRHLECNRKWILTISQPPKIIMHQTIKFKYNLQCTAELVVI